MSDMNLHSIGKRKTSVARVYLRDRSSETGKIIVNGRSFEEFFPRKSTRAVIMRPLEITETSGKYDIHVNVKGGGNSGQAGALRHAISRNLLLVDPTYRAALKKAGLLTRDSREVERKKYGLSGARRKYQYSKR